MHPSLLKPNVRRACQKAKEPDTQDSPRGKKPGLDGRLEQSVNAMEPETIKDDKTFLKKQRQKLADVMFY